MTYAAIAKERSGVIGDNLRKSPIFAVQIEITAVNCDTHLALSSRQSAKPVPPCKSLFQVSSMAVLYLYICFLRQTELVIFHLLYILNNILSTLTSTKMTFSITVATYTPRVA